MTRNLIALATAFCVGFILTAAFAASVALADHNSVSIHACWKIRNGNLRLASVDAQGVTFCKRNELPIQWPATCMPPPPATVELIVPGKTYGKTTH